MERGFRIVLIGIVIVALGYAGLSVWPILTATPPPANSYAPQGPGINPPPLVSPRLDNPVQGNPGANQPQPGAGQTTQGNPAGTQPAAPPSGPPSPSAAAPGVVNRRNPSIPKHQGPPLLTTPLPAREPEKPKHDQGWKYALHSSTLFVEPNGRPHIPSCLNNTPLVIGRGSHVVPLEYRDGWVMVRSPGQTLGWVRDSDLSDQPPVEATTEYLQ